MNPQGHLHHLNGFKLELAVVVCLPIHESGLSLSGARQLNPIQPNTDSSRDGLHPVCKLLAIGFPPSDVPRPSTFADVMGCLRVMTSEIFVLPVDPPKPRGQVMLKAIGRLAGVSCPALSPVRQREPVPNLVLCCTMLMFFLS